MSNLTTYENEIYYRFLSIEDKAYQEMVRFVEEYQDVIHKLDVEVMIEILYNYAHALYELKKYHQVIKLCDSLLETVISENIFLIATKDIFESLLILKGCCHFHNDQLDEAEHVYTELIKIHPTKEKHQEFLFKIQRDRNKNEEQIIRAISIVLFLLSSFIIGVELFVIRPFYDHFTQNFEFARNLCFIAAIALLLSYSGLKKYRNKQALLHIK